MLKDKSENLRRIYSSINKEKFDDVFLGAKEEYNWNCTSCNKVFKKKPSLIYDGKDRCSSCVRLAQAKGRTLASIKKFGSVDTLPEDISAEWFDNEPMHNISINSKKKYKWKCTYCSKIYFKIPYNQFLIPGCQACRRKKFAEIKRETKAINDGSFLDYFPEIAIEWNYKKNLKGPEKFPKYSTIIVWWICQKCSFNYEAPIYRRSYGKTGCPPCGRSSRLENIVIDFIFKTNLNFKINSYPIRLKEPNKNKRLQIDILLPELKLGFEIQDFATHSKVSDDEISDFMRLRQLKKGPAYHENKRRLAREQLGVALIDIWQDEIESGDFEEIILKAIRETERS